MTQLSSRQVHLDFHTSEHINDIGKLFDATHFAHMVKEAHINSMTVFARCHHGWLYYPSKQFPHLVHPHLKARNLLVDQVKALHAQGIKAPVYITVQWDYHSATTQENWLIRKPDGAHEGDSFAKPGFYQSLCVNTSYVEFLKAQTLEVIMLLGDDLDGLFFDIVGIRPCVCASCRAEMKRLDIDSSDEHEVRAFAKMVIDRFKLDMTQLVRTYHDTCTIFYNAGHVGPCSRESKESYTHFELESLPSGGWGYLHFPVAARYASALGKDCLGMTGKFHTEWGDFHSLKNLAALEFECFRMLAFGFACSIGDQMEPLGILNPATYELIGSVYEQVAQREEWSRPSVRMVEAAILTSEDPAFEHAMPDSVLGATQMLEEIGLQFDIIDASMSFDPYKLLFLVDDARIEADTQAKVERFVQNGGRVIACAQGGLNAQLQFPACFGITYQGQTAAYPDFIFAQGALCRNLAQDNEYVIYLQGNDIQPTQAKTLLNARAPYFKREGDMFCSHRYTPSAKGDLYPVATLCGNVLYFSHPLFTQYRANATRWCKQLMANAVDTLLPQRIVRHNGPSTLAVHLLSQPEKNRMALHVLSYIPVRKSATIDVIEERTPAYDITFEICLPKTIAQARLVPEGTPLDVSKGKIHVPRVDGYAIIEITF